MSNLRHTMKLGELADVVVAGTVDELLRLGRPLDRARDVEEVHSLRVATRRLRTDLGTFDACFAPRATHRLRSELRWLGRSIGTVRDLDVLEARLRGQRDALAPEDEEALTLLADRVREQRAARARTLGEVMSTERYLRLVEALGRLVASQTAEASVEHTRARRAVAGCERVAARWKDLEDAVGTLHVRSDETLVEPADEALHAIRILAKRCRYAAEAMVPVVGDDARRFARAITRVQSLLGAHQDSVAAEAWLRAPSSTTSRTRLVAGQLVMLERIERARCREAFGAVWQRAARPKRRAWF